jgi:PAS domain S-box-containing protein
VAKAADCKSAIRRFESGRLLQFFPLPLRLAPLSARPPEPSLTHIVNRPKMAMFNSGDVAALGRRTGVTQEAEGQWLAFRRGPQAYQNGVRAKTWERERLAALWSGRLARQYTPLFHIVKLLSDIMTNPTRDNLEAQGRDALFYIRLAVVSFALWVPAIVGSYLLDQHPRVHDLVGESLRTLGIVLVCVTAIAIARLVEGIPVTRFIVFLGAGALTFGGILNVLKEVPALASAPIIGEAGILRPSWTRDMITYSGAGMLIIGCLMAILDAVLVRRKLVIDIAERHRVQEALRESEARFRSMADAIPVLIWISGPDKHRHYFNRRWLEYRGRTLDEESGYGWTDGIHPDDLERCLATYENGYETHQEFRMEYRLRRADGEYRWMLVHGVPKLSPDGTFTGFIGGCIDITDRIEAERRLKLLNESLEERVVERTAVAEHRARQLQALAAELTHTEQRERRQLAQVLHDHLQQILVAAKFKVSLLGGEVFASGLEEDLSEIDNLLHQAIEASRSLTVELSPPILYDAGLAAALPWLARWMKEKHNFKIDLIVDPAAEPQNEEIRVLLFQAVRELLFNSVKHSGVREARLSMSCTGAGEVEIVVEDRGKGFDPSTMDARKEEGQGFGLFSIRERLSHLGGRMSVESALGQGAQLKLIAPIEVRKLHGFKPIPVDDMARATRGAAGDPTTDGAASIEPSRTGRTRVLIVDDHEIVREGLIGLLRAQEGIEIIGQAGDGESAVAMAAELKPDVVIMDVSLPGISGVEATRRISARFPDIRIVGLSMHVHEDMAASMRQAGAAAYCVKDGPSDALISAICEH